MDNKISFLSSDSLIIFVGKAKKLHGTEKHELHFLENLKNLGILLQRVEFQKNFSRIIFFKINLEYLSHNLAKTADLKDENAVEVLFETNT